MASASRNLGRISANPLAGWVKPAKTLADFITGNSDESVELDRLAVRGLWMDSRDVAGWSDGLRPVVLRPSLGTALSATWWKPRAPIYATRVTAS